MLPGEQSIFKTTDFFFSLKVFLANVLTKLILILENPHSTSVLLKRGGGKLREGLGNSTTWSGVCLTRLGDFKSLYQVCLKTISLHTVFFFFF